MRVGIMQPYFFPYIGYFQLIDSVDLYVNLDHVNFMKRSYMVRNVVKNGTAINVPIIEASQNKKCTESYTQTDEKYVEKFLKKIESLYRNQPNFSKVNDLLFSDSSVWCRGLSISQLNLHFIKIICAYLSIDTKIVETSEGLTERRKSKGLQDIVHTFDGSVYVNSIGGRALYSKEEFENSGIELRFIKMGEVDFDNPYASILDILFRYEKEHIVEQLKKYTLV